MNAMKTNIGTPTCVYNHRLRQIINLSLIPKTPYQLPAHPSFSADSAAHHNIKSLVLEATLTNSSNGQKEYTIQSNTQISMSKIKWTTIYHLLTQERQVLVLSNNLNKITSFCGDIKDWGLFIITSVKRIPIIEEPLHLCCAFMNFAQL